MIDSLKRIISSIYQHIQTYAFWLGLAVKSEMGDWGG